MAENESSSGISEEETMGGFDIAFPRHCQKHSKKIKRGTLAKINTFCELLQANKVKNSKTAFLELPFVVQCMFLEYAWLIISHQSKYSPDSIRTAFLLFKLFRGAAMKGERIYSRFTRLSRLDAHFKSAKGKSTGKAAGKVRRKPTTTSRKSKKYDKEFQRYEAPKSELDPLYLFYTSLYAEKPKSALAITWLTEHGVLDGAERQRLTRYYQKLKAAGKLIK
jgi:hypothetical protein